MDPVQNLSIKIDLVHDRGSMKPVQSGVHGPVVHVSSFGSKAIRGSSFQI